MNNHCYPSTRIKYVKEKSTGQAVKHKEEADDFKTETVEFQKKEATEHMYKNRG